MLAMLRTIVISYINFVLIPKTVAVTLTRPPVRTGRRRRVACQSRNHQIEDRRSDHLLNSSLTLRHPTPTETDCLRSPDADGRGLSGRGRRGRGGGRRGRTGSETGTATRDGSPPSPRCSPSSGRPARRLGRPRGAALASCRRLCRRRRREPEEEEEEATPAQDRLSR